MNRTQIYFDNAATTPLLPSVKSAMEPFWSETYGNASSPYATSRVARMALDGARIQVAKLIGAHADEIVWTGGGTESDNWALLGVAFANSGKARPFHRFANRTSRGFRTRWGRCANWVSTWISRAPIPMASLSRTRLNVCCAMTRLLVSVMSLNNEVGALQPIAQIAKLCRERGVLFHTDATQSAGKEPLDVDFSLENGELGGADLLTLSAHKIGGPKGVGALYIRRGTRMKPLLRGGAQERGRRAGTENVPGIAGFGAAATAAREGLATNSAHLEKSARAL